MHSCLFFLAFVGCDFGDLGGGDSVRTRNTLHEVGAQSLREASDSAVSPRVCRESETQTHRENHYLTFSISQ